MGLLSEQEKREIRDAVRLVTDTFMVTPIVYCIAGYTKDRWGEDQADRQYYGMNLEVLREDESNEILESLQGAEDAHKVKLTLNLEYLQEKGLITPDFKVKFNDTEDFFVLKGEEYKVIDVSYDGPLDSKDVLVVVTGEKREWTNQLDNTQMILTAINL